MSVSTESRYGGEPKIEVISPAAPAEEHLVTGAIDGTSTPERKITHWGIMPMNSRLLVSTGFPNSAAEAARHEPMVTLRIDY